MRLSTRVRATVTATLLLVVVPSHLAVAQAQKASTRPTPGPAKPFVFPKVVDQILSNGLRIAVLENHELPIVAVRVGLPAGTFVDAGGKEGGWSVMVNSLREGTTTRSAATIAESAADLGAPISWTSITPTLGPPTFTSSFTTVRSSWKPALALLADMVMHPGFPADGVRRAQTALATTASRPTPSTLAQRILAVRLYGADHPYTRYPTDSSIRAVTRDDLIALQSTYLRPQNTTIVIAGDVTPAEARTAVEAAFSSWEKGGASIEPSIPAPAAATMPTTIFLRDQPGAAQSLVIGGQLVPSRTSAEAIAVEAVAAVVGGGSGGSRLWDAFRINRGLSYAPVNQILWRPEAQPASQVTVMPVPTAKTDTAVMEWLRIVREAHGSRPVTDAELQFSRRSLVGSMPVQMEIVDTLASRTLGLIQNRLPTNFYNQYVGRMNSLTLAEVQAAAMKYLDPDHLIIAVVGDRARIEAGLRATGIPVVIVDH